MARMESRRFMTTSFVIALLGATLVGCGWRLETPDPGPPSPDANEQARDAAAIAEAAFIESLEYADPIGPGGEWLIEYETRAAPAHLEALGGVYDPFPEVSPTPSVSPTASPTVAPFGPFSFSRFAGLARNAALEGALTVEDPDLALLLASIGLSHAAALRLQSEEDILFLQSKGDPTVADDAMPVSDAISPSADRPLPLSSTPVLASFGPALLVPEETALPEETLEELIVLHDDAAYVSEVVAARAEGSLRGVAYQRSLLHQARAEALAALAEADPRGPSYVTDRARLASNETMMALLSEVEGNLADAYIAAFADVIASDADTPSERTWLLSGAYDALVASILLSTGPGELSTFPGVTVSEETEPSAAPTGG